MSLHAIHQGLLDTFTGGQLELFSNGERRQGEIARAKLTGQHESAGLKVETSSMRTLQGETWVPTMNNPWLVPFALHSLSLVDGTLIVTDSEDKRVAALHPPSAHSSALS